MKNIGFYFNLLTIVQNKWRKQMSRLNINFTSVCIIIAFVFVCSFLYLNQKVGIYVSAYKLNDNYLRYEELVSKRDYLMYTYNKYVSIPRVNEWAGQNNFSFEANRMLALDLRRNNINNAGQVKAASIFNRLASIPSGISTVLAHNTDR